MGYKLKTAPAVEPITLAEAKLHLKIETADTADESLITALIVAARESVENYLGKALVNQTWEYSFEEFEDDEIDLHPANLSSITSITYKDANGATQTLAATVYEADTYTTPGRACLKYNQLWPTTQDIQNAILITYVVGFGAAAANVPGAIKAALLLTIGNLYEHRESVVIGANPVELPQGVAFLLDPYRSIEF